MSLIRRVLLWAGILRPTKAEAWACWTLYLENELNELEYTDDRLQGYRRW